MSIGMRANKKYPTIKPNAIRKQIAKLKGIFLKKKRVEKKINPDTIPNTKGKKKFHSTLLSAALKRAVKINFKKSKSNTFKALIRRP